MANAWEHAAQKAEEHAKSGGIFVRLTGDGDKIVGAFCGEPYAREVVWTGEKYETHDPDVHAGKRPSLRVMLNFYVPTDDAMKVIEGGSVWFKDVLKVRDKYGLGKWLFEIQRSGGAGDPKTTYSILPEEKLTAELMDDIAKFTLHDLESFANGDSTSGEDEPAIDGDTAVKLVARLKGLPRAAVNTFLGEFKVQRVRDLRKSDVEAARDMLIDLEARAARHAQPEPVEVNPFA